MLSLRQIRTMPTALWAWLHTSSADAELAQCVSDMGHIAQECAWNLAATGCNGIGVDSLRREGDAKRQRVHQLLDDSSLSYSPDTRGFERISKALDEVIGAMHRVVHHVRHCRSTGCLGGLPREAHVILKIIVWGIAWRSCATCSTLVTGTSARYGTFTHSCREINSVPPVYAARSASPCRRPIRPPCISSKRCAACTYTWRRCPIACSSSVPSSSLPSCVDRRARWILRPLSSRGWPFSLWVQYSGRMSHPFSNMFEKALKKSTPEDNLVLEEAEMLRKRGYSPREIFDVLEKLHRELVSDADRAVVGEALEEFRTYVED